MALLFYYVAQDASLDECFYHIFSVSGVPMATAYLQDLIVDTKGLAVTCSFLFCFLSPAQI